MRLLLPLSGLIDHRRPVATSVHTHRLLGDAERHVRMLLLDINRLGNNVVISLVQVATDSATVLPLLILLLQDRQIVVLVEVL